jgi:hypothetical protein
VETVENPDANINIVARDTRHGVRIKETPKNARRKGRFPIPGR